MPSAPSAMRAGPSAETQTITRVVAASLAGTSLEWYDFFIYGAAAAIVFPKLFFPQTDPATATFLSLTTYGVAFVARPLGAIIFGHFGDIIGRKRILIITLLMMGFATFLIGCLPTYPTAGVLAPIGLVVLRLSQGLALGGEWGGAALMVNEYDPKGHRRGFLGSLVQIASPIGLLFANGVLALVTWQLAPDAFLAWGWRIPFLLSAILVVFGFVIRMKIAETPLFERVEATHSASRMPIVDVMRTSWREVLIGIGSRIGSDIVFYVFTLFLLIYLPQRLGLSNTTALTAVLAAAGAQIVSITFFGALSDRVGRRPVLIGGALGAIIWSFVFFVLLDTKNPALIILASSVGMIIHAAMWGPLASYLPEMFDTRVRCTGASVSFQLAGIFGNAPAPLIATQLLAIFNSSVPVSLYVSASLILVAVCALLAKDTAHIDLGTLKLADDAAGAPFSPPRAVARPEVGR
jgi:metabolite-proton symporter